MPLYTLGKSRVENLCNPPNLPIVSKFYGNFELEMGSKITLNAFFLSDLNNSQQQQPFDNFLMLLWIQQHAPENLA